MLYKRNDTLALSLALTFIMVVFVSVMNVSYKGQLSEAENEIKDLKESEKLKEDEILKLELKIKSVDEKLSEKEDSILKLEEKLKKVENENKRLEEELKKYDSLRKLNIVATAYDAFCNTGCTGVTATGYDVKNTVYKDGYRVVAVDPKVIPLGSLLYVETKNDSFVGIAEDTGGDIKGNRIDVLMENRSTAYDFGRQSVTVIVVREGRGA